MNLNNEFPWLRTNSTILFKASKIREAFPLNDSERKKQKTDSPSPAKKSKISLD